MELQSRGSALCNGQVSRKLIWPQSARMSLMTRPLLEAPVVATTPFD